MNRNFLQAEQVDTFRQRIGSAIVTGEPADGAGVLTLMDAIYDSTTQFKKFVYDQILSGMGSVSNAGGQLTGAVTVTGGGTGYAVGDKMPVTGATSGEGGVIVVTAETGGIIDTCEIWSAGNNYVGALTIDVTAPANSGGDAVLAMASAATYEDQAVIAEAKATIAAAGSASLVAVNAGGTGYSEDDQLTLANGIVITVGQTAGVVDTVKSIDTNVANLDANATAVACTGGTGGDDATFDVTAVLL